MVNKDMRNEIEKMFDFLQELIEGKNTKYANTAENVEVTHSCGGGDEECCGAEGCCGKHKKQEEPVNTPEEDSSVDTETNGEEQDESMTKDIYLPLACEGEMVDLKAIYDKKVNKMKLFVKTDGAHDGVKFRINQEITLDCSEVPIDTTTLDVEYDDMGALIFSANLLPNDKRNGSIVEFC